MPVVKPTSRTSREGDRPGPRRRRQRPDEQRRQQDAADLPGDGGDRDGPGADPDLAGAHDQREHDEAGEVLAGGEVEPPAGEQGPDLALAQRRCAVGDLGEPAARQIGVHTVRATTPTISVPSTIVAVNGTRRSRSGTPPVRREAHSSKEACGAGAGWGAGLGRPGSTGPGRRGLLGGRLRVRPGVGAGAAGSLRGPSAGSLEGVVGITAGGTRPVDRPASRRDRSPPGPTVPPPRRPEFRRLRGPHLGRTSWPPGSGTIVCVAPACPATGSSRQPLVRSVPDFCG